MHRTLRGAWVLICAPKGNAAGDNPGGPSCCLNEVGSLLRTLAAAQPGGRIGEIGSGADVGTAWLADGLGSGATLVTTETDTTLAGAVQTLFANRRDVRVLASHWRQALPDHGPFDLLFADGGNAADPASAPDLASLVRPGGLVVVDDLTPEEDWPESWRGRPDPKREVAFRSGLFSSAEVLVRPGVAVLLMTRAMSGR